MSTTTTAPRFKVTRTFTSGNLKGLTYTEVTTVRFTLGKHYKSTSDYTITEIIEL